MVLAVHLAADHLPHLHQRPGEIKCVCNVAGAVQIRVMKSGKVEENLCRVWPDGRRYEIHRDHPQNRFAAVATGCHRHIPRVHRPARGSTGTAHNTTGAHSDDIRILLRQHTIDSELAKEVITLLPVNYSTSDYTEVTNNGSAPLLSLPHPILRSRRAWRSHESFELVCRRFHRSVI